jgi:transposase
VQIAAVKAQLDAVIADLDTRIRTLEQEIAVVLREQAWAESAILLQSIHSIGPLTTAWLLVGTLTFRGCPSPAAAVAYVGLAPMLQASGSSTQRVPGGRPQIGHGGHKRLRTALYLATFNAVRFNSVIKVLYERLRAAGKPPKVARCAAAGTPRVKVLQSAWAVVHSGQAFDPYYARRIENVEGHQP